MPAHVRVRVRVARAALTGPGRAGRALAKRVKADMAAASLSNP